MPMFAPRWLRDTHLRDVGATLARRWRRVWLTWGGAIAAPLMMMMSAAGVTARAVFVHDDVRGDFLHERAAAPAEGASDADVRIDHLAGKPIGY